MTKKSDPIVFFGNERLATAVTSQVSILRALIAAGYEIEEVITSSADMVSRQKRDLEIGAVAHAAGIPVVLTGKSISLEEKVKKHRTDVAVLAAFGQIIPRRVIDMFPKGIINIHPSLLPKHRGPTPIESVILSGEKVTGVSLMQLSAAMDAGPVYAQSEVNLNGRESKQTLANQMAEIGSTMLIDLLPGILDGSVVALPQDNSAATYDRLLTKEDGLIDWHKPALQLEREVRAFAGWPGSYSSLSGIDVTITAAHIEDTSLMPGKIKSEDQQLLVGCGEGSLAIDRLKPAGKQEMDAKAFLAGYGKRLIAS